MQSTALPPPKAAQRKPEATDGPRLPKRVVRTNRLTEPTMEMLSAALQAHECLEVNRYREDGLAFSTADERSRQEESRRQNALIVGVSAFAGVALAVFENELRWSSRVSGEGLGPHGLLTALKGITVGLTLVTFFFLYQYYDAAVSLRRLSGVRLGSGVSLRSLRGAGLLYQFLLEILIMIPQPLPGVDATFRIYNKGLGKYSVYSVDSIMCVAMFVRFAYLPRFYGEVISDLRSDAALAISRINSVVFDNAFVVRYVLANSLNCVVLVTSLLIILFAYMMMVFERPVDNGTLGNYANCVWLIIITMTTVGYGDEFPTTVLGRFVAVMASLAAVVLLAVTTNLVVSQLTLSRSEAKVIEVMDTISLRDDLRESAAVVVQRWMRAYLQYMRKNRGGVGQRGASNKAIKSATRLNIDLCAAVLSDVELLESISVFKDTNAAYFSQRLQNDVPELLGNLNSKLFHQEQRIQNLAKLSSNIDRLAGRLCDLKGRPRE